MAAYLYEDRGKVLAKADCWWMATRFSQVKDVSMEGHPRRGNPFSDHIAVTSTGQVSPCQPQEYWFPDLQQFIFSIPEL